MRGGLPALDNDAALEIIYTNAFVDTNKKLHASNEIDDSLSGTTGITILVRGDHLYIGNVGDSRAIIASVDDGGKMKYSPLSHDQVRQLYNTHTPLYTSINILTNIPHNSDLTDTLPS